MSRVHRHLSDIARAAHPSLSMTNLVRLERHHLAESANAR